MASNGSSTMDTQTASPPSTASSPDPSETFVYWLDIALLGVVALFFTAALPRALGRLSDLTNMAKGFTLRSGSPSKFAAQVYGGSVMQQHSTDRDFNFSSYTLYPGEELRGDGKLSSQSSPLRHVSSLSSVMHPISSFFSRSLTPDKTFAKLTLSISYIVGILVVVFYSGDPLANPERLGIIAISQIPFVVALGTKNSPISLLLSVGYERLNYLHRLVGIVMVMAANIHALGFLYKFAFAGTLSSELKVPFVAWGVTALVGLELLYFFSIPFFRQRCYTVFVGFHLTGLFLFMLGVAMHQEVAVKYVLIGIAIYGVDHIMRAVKSRVTKARIKTIPELGVTQIEIPALTTGWRAGQHVRIRFLTTEFGTVGWTIAHPFTIATASDSAEGKGLTLLCKKSGKWTRSLYAAAERATQSGAEDGNGRSRQMSVIVEGPYGGLGNMVLSSYSGYMVVTGGSGITLALSTVEEIIQLAQMGKSNVRFIEIVWSTQDIKSLKPLFSTFTSIIAACNLTQDVKVKVTVRYTRVSAVPEEKPDFMLDPPILGLEIQPGRPNLKKTLDSLVVNTASLKGPRGVAVCVCGPVGLAAEIREVVRNADGSKRSSVGGIELHEEVFGW